MHTGTHVPYSPMGFFPKINRHETHLRESSQYCPSSGNSEQKKISRFQIMDASIGAIWPYNETEQHAETQRGSDLPKVIQQMSAGAQVGTQAPGAPGPAPPREVREWRSLSKLRGDEYHCSIPEESQWRESWLAQFPQKVFKAFPNLIYVKKSLESHSPLISCQQCSEGGEGRGDWTRLTHFPEPVFKISKMSLAEPVTLGHLRRREVPPTPSNTLNLCDDPSDLVTLIP